MSHENNILITPTKHSPKYLTVTVILLLAFTVLTGCAGREVSEENRNTDGRYDGKWTAEIGTTPTKVRIENWRISCTNMAGDMPLSVSKGKIKATWRGYLGYSNVSDEGNFRILIPYIRKIKNRVGNSRDLNRGINIIVEGSLSEKRKKGRLTLGYEDFANQGCSSKMKFSQK